MAKAVNKLTDKIVKSLIAKSEAGVHPDGAGLFLTVSNSGAASWLCRYSVAGRVREAGLGSFKAVTLAEARVKASALRQGAATGADPVATRKAEQTRDKRTFEAVAEAYLSNKESGWRSAVHRRQWHNSLALYVYPIFGDKLVDQITDDHVLAAVRPLWRDKAETANRIISRVRLILDFATAKRFRTGDNPAMMAQLKHSLPDRVKRVVHHPSMHWQDVPSFVTTLKGKDAMSALALRFLIFTGTRSGEARGVRWSEISDDMTVWTLPLERMKTGKTADHPFRIPLSTGAQAVLREVLPLKRGADDLVFPGFSKKEKKPLSDVALAQMLPAGVTCHGFRTSLRTWIAEETDASFELGELCLAHQIGNAVSRAYHRSDLLEQRRAVMQRWSDYVDGRTVAQTKTDALIENEAAE